MQHLLTCVASLPAAGRFKRALQLAAGACFLAAICCLDLHAQKFELAKISLGMSEQDVKTALGPGYQFLQETAQGFPNLLYVYAGNGSQRSAYTFALIDGKVQAFQAIKRFPEGQYPLIETVRKSVADKLWQPEKPNGSTWLSDSAGRPLADTPQLNCEGHARASGNTGFVRVNAAKIPPATYEVMKDLEQPLVENSKPECGIYVAVSSTQFYSNPALAIDTGLRVENIAAFGALARQQQQRKLDQQKAQTQQANKTKSPF
jgi:hypothetical protein